MSGTKSYLPTRKTRRRIVIATLAYIAVTVTGILIFADSESTLHTNIASDLVYLAGIIIVGYALSASWDNQTVLTRNPITKIGRDRNLNYSVPEEEDWAAFNNISDRSD